MLILRIFHVNDQMRKYLPQTAGEPSKFCVMLFLKSVKSFTNTRSNVSFLFVPPHF